MMKSLCLPSQRKHNFLKERTNLVDYMAGVIKQLDKRKWQLPTRQVEQLLPVLVALSAEFMPASLDN